MTRYGRPRPSGRSTVDLDAIRGGFSDLLSTWGDVWPEPVDGNALLADLATEVNSFVKLPEGGLPTVALWTVFSWAHEAFHHSPILALTSAIHGEGKTRVQEVMNRLVPKPEVLENPTGPSLFGLGELSEVGEHESQQPSSLPTLPQLTLLGDEVDAWMKLDNQIKVVLNSGFQRGGRIPRRSGRRVIFYSTWFPKCIAFIEGVAFALPLATRSRCIIVPMKRATTTEKKRLKRFRSAQKYEELVVLKRKMSRWVFDHFSDLRDSDPPLPDELDDRQQDGWRPLFAIASLAGGSWPEITWTACLRLTGLVGKSEAFGELLIRDIHEIFVDHNHPDWLPSMLVIVPTLKSVEGRPWTQLLSGATDVASATKLAQMLNAFGVESDHAWHLPPGESKRGSFAGYYLSDLKDAFDHYLESPCPVCANIQATTKATRKVRKRS